MYVVSYDISSNKLRAKIAKVLEGYGKRVQYSVFECHLTKAQYQQMHEKLVRLLMGGDENENGIRIYALCGKCEKNMRSIGAAIDFKSEEDDVYII